MSLRVEWQCLIPNASAQTTDASPVKAPKKKDGDKTVFPSPRTGAMLLVHKDRLLVIGGGDAMDCHAADLVGHSPSGAWSAVPMTGKIPPPRRHFAWTVAGESAYLTGGALFGSALLDDLYELKLSSMQWVSLPTKIPYQRRHSHSIVKVGQKLYAFGGCSAGDTAYDDLLVYSPAVKGWLVVQPSQHDGDDRAPSKRFKHSMTAVGSTIFLFGGMCGDVVLNDLWSINMGTAISDAKQPESVLQPHISWQRVDVGTIPRSIGTSLIAVRPPSDASDSLMLAFCGGWSAETAAPMEHTLSVVQITRLAGAHGGKRMIHPPRLNDGGDISESAATSNFTKFFGHVTEDVKAPNVPSEPRSIAATLQTLEANAPVSRIDSSWVAVNGQKSTLYCFGGSLGPFSLRNDVWSCTVEAE